MSARVSLSPPYVATSLFRPLEYTLPEAEAEYLEGHSALTKADSGSMTTSTEGDQKKAADSREVVGERQLAVCIVEGKRPLLKRWR